MAKRGGRRIGAGRPTNIVVQTRAETAIADKLKNQVNIALGVVEQNYKQLMDSAVTDALAGDSKMKMFLIELPFKLIKFTDEPTTPFTELRQKWSITHSEERVTSLEPDKTDEDGRPVIEATGTIVA